MTFFFFWFVLTGREVMRLQSSLRIQIKLEKKIWILFFFSSISHLEPSGFYFIFFFFVLLHILLAFQNSSTSQVF